MLQSAVFLRLPFINELYVDWKGACQFPVKSLTVLPTVFYANVGAGWGDSYCLDCLRSLMGNFPIKLHQTAQATWLRALEITISEYTQLSSVLYLQPHILPYFHLQIRTYLPNNSAVSCLKYVRSAPFICKIY